MENKVPVYKIIRNIASNGSEYSKEIQDWLSISIENKKIYQDLQNLWMITGKLPERFSPNKTIAWKKVQGKIHSKKRKYFLYRRIGQIAAAIVVLFFSVWMGTELNTLWQVPQYTEVISLSGQKTRVILPDSSNVLLNGSSIIRYNNDFNRNERKVELDGEGYFDIRKDLSKQFIVSTSELDVKVYGTSFNVNTFEDDQTVEVGVKNGSVAIERNEKELIKLASGDLATFDKKSKKLHVQKMDIDLVSAWTRGELVFEEESMAKIIKVVERWYGVDIHIDPGLLDEELLTFKVKTESLQELFKLINLLKPIDYQINGKQVIINKP